MTVERRRHNRDAACAMPRWRLEDARLGARSCSRRAAVVPSRGIARRGHRASSRSCRRPPRCSLPSAPARASSPSAATTTSRRRSTGCRASGRCSIPTSSASWRLRPDLAVVYGTQHDLKEQLDAGGRADVHLHPRRPGRRDVHHPALGDPDRHVRARRRPSRPGSSVTSVRSAIAFAAGRGRRRCSCSAGSRARCEICTRAAASGSCTTCSRSRAARTCSPIRSGSRCRPAPRRCWRAAPEVVIEIQVEGDAPADLAAWQAVPAIPAVRSKRSSC